MRAAPGARQAQDRRRRHPVRGAAARAAARAPRRRRSRWSTSSSTRATRRPPATRSCARDLCEEAIRLGRLLAQLHARRRRGARPARADAAARRAPGRARRRRRRARRCSRTRTARAGTARRSRRDAALDAASAAARRPRAATRCRPRSPPARTAPDAPTRPTGARSLALYDELMRRAPSPVVELNRAVARGHGRGPRGGPGAGRRAAGGPRRCATTRRCTRRAPTCCAARRRRRGGGRLRPRDRGHRQRGGARRAAAPPRRRLSRDPSGSESAPKSCRKPDGHAGKPKGGIAIGFWYLAAMEPSTVGRKGTLSNPEVYENVPGHIIPAIAQEFDDFDNEAEKFLAGDTPENEFIGFRLKQGVYGQRQPDVQMIRVKLPFGGITPDQMDAFASVIEKYVPLNKGHITTRQNIQMHHVPLRDAAKLIRELADANLSSREGCGNTVRNVTGDPWAGSWRARSSTPRRTRAPTCATSCATPRRSSCRARSRRPSRARRTRTARSPASTTSRSSPSIDATASRASRCASAAARRSCRGSRRRCSTSSTADDGEYLKVDRGRPAHLRPPGLAARQPRPCPHQGVRRQVRHRGAAPAGRRGAAGRLGRRARLRPAMRAAVRDRRGGARARRRRRPTARPNGDGASSTRWRDVERRPPSARTGFSTVAGQGRPRRPHARAAPRPRRRSCATTPAATPARRSHQNLVLRWVRDEAVYDVWQALSELGLGDAGADEINDVVTCPGTDSLQARHHELDGPQPRGQRAHRVDGHRGPAHRADPHQDVRLPERLQPAPHRQHRVLRRVDQGRRAHDPRLRRPHRRQLRGRRGRSTAPA